MSKNRLPLHDRIYRRLLHLLPFDFQREYGGDMANTFRHQRKHARSLFSLWCSTVGGIITTAPVEHFDVLRQDLRYAVRALLKKPGFTIIILLTLALGIGANTALFSLTDAVLFTQLPVERPEELVRFDWLSGQRVMARNVSGSTFTDSETGLQSSASVSYPAFVLLRKHSQTTDVFAFAPMGSFNVVANGQPEAAVGQYVSGNYFGTLDVPTIVGRAITDDDDLPAAGPVAVISYRYWERRFALDPGIIGMQVTINSVPATIIGVSSRGFPGTYGFAGESVDISVPFSFDTHLRSRRLEDAGNWWLRTMGRVKRGVLSEQVRAELEPVFQQSARDGWTAALATSPRTESVESRSVPRLRVRSGSLGLRELNEDMGWAILLSLAVIFGVLLLIVCLNIANLLLSRARFRQGEIAVRLAMGAGRSRLIRQLMTEGLVVGLFGGVGGVLVAYWGKDLFQLIVPSNNQMVFDLAIDWKVLAFNSGLSLVAGLLFGIVPAFGAIRNNLAPAIKEGARSVSGSTWRSTKILVTAQVAISVVLLVVAGLFFRTLDNLQRVDVGFKSENLVMFTVIPATLLYEQDRLARLYEEMVEAIDAAPGVIATTRSSYPLVNRSGGSTISIYAPGTALGSEPQSVRRLRVRSNFFSALGIPMLQGRDLTSRDDQSAPKVAIINETLARMLFPTGNPVGARFGFGLEQADIEIVGVARNVRIRRANEPVPPTIYYPDLQEITRDSVTFQIRTASDPFAVVPAIRQAMLRLDPNVAMFDIKSQNQLIADGFLIERLLAVSSTFFSGIVLFLAGIGLYGILSNTVVRRTREIGIRIALGARSWQVIRTVVREASSSVVIGLILGLAGAFAVSRLATTLLYGLSPYDPMTFAVVVLAMIVTAGLAAFLPARRAARMDPTAALRSE